MRAYRIAYPGKGKAAAAKYYSKNREAMKSKSAKWRAENPEAVSSAVKIWRRSNPEKVRKYKAEWKSNNLEYDRLASQNRKARKKANGGVLSAGLATKLLKLQKGKCPCCGKPLGRDYHLDHKMPLALGGANEDWNMQLLRGRCNESKSAKHPVDFMQSRGFLL